MKTHKNRSIQGSKGKPILVDTFFIPSAEKKPVVVFVHGYKGFKDWGAWNLMAEAFAKAGFFFVKFNFSHNGGTIEEPIDFPDLEAFGNNNYTKELDDLGAVLDWITRQNEHLQKTNVENITLIGHSRGGGIALLKAKEDTRVKKVITLASVSDFKSRFPKGDAFEKWKKDGVYYVKNGRTKQEMPHYFQFYNNFIENEERLTIKKATENLKIPLLIVHGDADTSVTIQEAENLKKWKPDANYEIIANADHVFNTKHPWHKQELSDNLKIVLDKSIAFLK